MLKPFIIMLTAFGLIVGVTAFWFGISRMELGMLFIPRPNPQLIDYMDGGVLYIKICVPILIIFTNVVTYSLVKRYYIKHKNDQASSI